LTSTHAFSTLPQWTPEQDVVVPGPMQRQSPAQGCPQPIVPAGAQVAGSVVEVVLVVLVVWWANGAHTILARTGVTVLAPNWSCVGTAGSVVFRHRIT
jgi:hypothetical protein